MPQLNDLGVRVWLCVTWMKQFVAEDEEQDECDGSEQHDRS